MTARILLIDQHAEWIQFASEVLQGDFEVVTETTFERAYERCLDENPSAEFDLILVGLDLVRSHLSTITELSRGRSRRVPLVVMFPVFQDDETLRLLFRAGVDDCVDKPYDREGLLQLVADELTRALRPGGTRRFLRRRESAEHRIAKLETVLSLS